MRSTSYQRSSTEHERPAAIGPTLEHPPCAVCGSVTAEPLVVRKGYQVVKCGDCGLVYISPRPRDRGNIESLYTNPRYCNRQILHANHAGRVGEARWRLDQVERHVAARGRLLDVGCSAASFLLAARERGWDVAGIDISAGAIEYARSVHGLTAMVGTLEEIDVPDGAFDVVTVFECIEHMRQPADALRAAHRVLRRNGVLVITTPNIDGLFPRVTYRLLARTIGAWEHPTPPHHLYQFSRRTLSALLHNTGFEVVSGKTRPMGLRYTVRQMQSAIIDALKRRYARRGNPSPGTTSVTQSGRGARAPRAWRRLGRGAIAAFCWLLSGVLYAVPVSRLGLGDSMIILARKP